MGEAQIGFGPTVPAGEVTAAVAAGSVSDHLVEMQLPLQGDMQGDVHAKAVHSSLMIAIVFGTGIKLKVTFPVVISPSGHCLLYLHA